MKPEKATNYTKNITSQETVKSDLWLFLWKLACARGAIQAGPNVPLKDKTPGKIDEILGEIDKQVHDDGKATGEEALKFINSKKIKSEIRNKKVLSEAKLGKLLQGLENQKNQPLIRSGESFKISASVKDSPRDAAIVHTSFTVEF